MKKRILFAFFCIISIYGHAELTVKLNVETPGSLSTMIASSKKYEITSLTLTGMLNGTDIMYIREMAGANNKASLTYLDISGVDIVSGGSYYYKKSDAYWLNDFTEDNVITDHMFYDCKKLQTLILPNSIIKITEFAFDLCNLVSITLPEKMESFECKLESYSLSEIRISEFNQYFKVVDGVLYSNDMRILYRCPVNYANPTFEIPEGVHIVYKSAFYSCSYIKEFIFPSSLESFQDGSLSGMSLNKFIFDPNITYSYIGSFTSIEEAIILDGYTSFNARSIFGGGSGRTSLERGEIKADNVKVYCENPPVIADVWSTFNTATLAGNLYVPKGTYSAYYIAFGWGDFAHIYEMDNDENKTRCAKPTISYSNGKLTFKCGTDGVTYKSTITDSDISSYNSNEVQLYVTYNISVYATKAGYENSETSTATLCWVDQQPITEGITNNLSQIPARAVLIQGQSGILTIQGVDDGTNIAVYTVSGQMVSSTKASGPQTSLATNIKKGEVAIIKIGEKSIKMVMQ